MRIGAVVLCALAFVGCSTDPLHGIGHTRDNPKSVRDTTGAVFGWACDSQGCKLMTLASTPPPPDCGPTSTYTYFVEHFVRICSGMRSDDFIVADYEWCRPAACTLTDDCPVFDGADYQCLEGTCQLEGIPLHRYDVEALCLANHARAASCSVSDPEVKRVESLLGTACAADGGPDPTCSVPASCPQP